jgi:hypothetical protein
LNILYFQQQWPRRMPFFADLQAYAPLFPWIGAAVALGALIASLHACWRRRLLDNLPVSKTQGVFIGLVELKGTAECEQPLLSYLAAMPCVQYSFNIEEQWSRQVTTMERDDRGNMVERTHTEVGWTTVASETRSTPFYLQDDTGHIQIQPEGAHIEGHASFSETCTPMNALFYAKGPPGLVMNSDGIRRFTESVVPLHAPLFVVGPARERQDRVAPEIAAAAKEEFLISTRTQEEVSRGIGWQFWLFLLLGAVLAPGGQIAGDLSGNQDITAVSILIYTGELALYLAVWTVGWTITVYNSLVTLRQRVEQGWGQVDIQLKRRHDLIPNLIDTVKGYQAHEAATQQAVTEMRAQLSATPPGQSGGDIRSVSGPVQLLREAYPELKANQNFLALQTSLAETEQRIALARSYYNSIATFFNTRLQVVPDRYIAAIGGMKPKELMAANDFERAPVQVDFGTAAEARAVTESLPPIPAA